MLAERVDWLVRHGYIEEDEREALLGRVCPWCQHGEEHHGVGERQLAQLERRGLLLSRCSHALGATNPALETEIDAELNRVLDGRPE